MAKIKAVFFDLDDTLYPAVETYRHGLRYAWKAFRRRKRVSFPYFLRAYKRARLQVQSLLRNDPSCRNRLLYFKRLIENELGGTSPALTLAVSSAYEKCFDRLRPLTAPWLKQMAKTYRLGVITNLTGHMQLLKLRRLDPRGEIFSIVVTSEEAGAEKPSPLPYREACRRAQCRPAQAIMIGNSLRDDVRAAKRAGLRAIHLSFNNLERLPALLEKIIERA